MVTAGMVALPVPAGDMSCHSVVVAWVNPASVAAVSTTDLGFTSTR